MVCVVGDGCGSVRRFLVPEQKDNGLRVGPYELLTRLASGGMGEVFIARRTGAGDFEKKVALKLLLPHLVPDQEFVQRFFDEARLAARMNHPNLVQIFDVGESDGRPYLAMALIEGISLGRFLKVARAKKLVLPLPIFRLIATGLLEGLAYAHTLKGTRGEELGVIHRDVTPSNLLLSTAGSVMLNDFGIAKAAINEHQTRPGTVRGKFAYVAPEQAHRGRLTLRADLFSAAVTLYETLTLVSPFFHPGDVQTMDAVVKHVPPPARTLRREVSEQMSRALDRALSKKPEDRFASARQFREALVDGPVATAPELGELVQRLCGEDLKIFEKLHGGGEASGTASLLLMSSAAPVTPPRRSRFKRFAWLTGSMVAGFAVVLLILSLSRAAPEPQRPEAPLELTAVPVHLEQPRPEALVPPVEDVPPAPVETSPPVPHPVRASRPVLARPSAEAVRVGYLSADAEPWATVLLDGQPLDRTPLSRFPVPVGKHTLVFRSADGLEQLRPLLVEEGKVNTVRVEFPDK